MSKPDDATFLRELANVVLDLAHGDKLYHRLHGIAREMITLKQTAIMRTEQRNQAIHDRSLALGEVERLRARVADLEEAAASAPSVPDLLEQRVEAELAECAEGWANDTESEETLAAAMWLLIRKLGRR